MKREIAPIGDMPNYELTVNIMKEATNRYLGFGISPFKMAQIKSFVNTQVASLIDTGEWVTKSFHKGRKIEFKELEIVHSPKETGALSIIPVWEYEEEK